MTMQLPQPRMLEGRFILISLCVSLLGTTTEGQQYNLTGSSEFAVLGKAFTWTCEMFIPQDQTGNGVTFYRNSVVCGSVGLVPQCKTLITDPKYTFGCLTESSYTLTIPAENMTENEQGSVWRCEYPGDGSVRSPDVTLNISNHQYNLTGSSEYAVLGKAFTWTCEMFIPPGQTIIAVRFLRNNQLCANVGHKDEACLDEISNTRYTYGCSSTFSYTLTIPAENMTAYEKESMWMCEYIGDSRFRSLVATLHIAVDVHSVSLIPGDNPLTLAEGVQKMIQCVVNSNAVPAPTITWYLGSTDITNMAGSNVSSIIITGNREDNNKTLACKATNNNRPSKTGATTLNVEYPPSVIPLTQKDTVEGQDFLIICGATPGNPTTSMFVWIKVNDTVFRQNGSTVQLPNIQRKSSGTYKCIAENTFSNGRKGTDSQEMVVNVLYKPVIKGNFRTFVNETKRVVLTREIDSNPLSNVSWYDGAVLLKTQTFAEIANLTIENALSTDTKNFTLIVSNAIQRNVTSMVELIVNCKPKAEDDEITIAITSATRRISMSTTVMAYPQPRYILKFENGTTNNMMTVYLHKNAINNFTVHCEQQFAQEMDSVTYILELSNILGASTVFIRILKQEKPSPPTILEAECEGTGARIKWKSSFDGGAVQFFFIVALSDTYKASRSDTIKDKGENQTHQTVIPFLRPSVLYTFYVFAKNSIGVTLSEGLNCTTLKDIQKTSNTSNQTLEVVGSVAGVVVVLALAIVLSCFAHRHFTLICNIGFRRRSNHVKTADLIEEKSHYTVMSEQEAKNGRNPYDVLTPTESSNQYEAIQMKESQKTDANTYECLNKPENIPPRDNTTKDSNKPGILKTTDASSSSNTEEYANTSFEN